MISIVVVTYNCKNYLEDTLQSILKQTSLQYEVCFIDGRSSDGTVDLIKRYKICFENKGIKVNFTSEKDMGIYDAMNKGIYMAKGDYIYFLNAKDKLYNETVIENVIKFSQTNKFDIIYGDIDNGKIIKQNKKVKKQLLFNGICHQSAFIKKKLFEEIGTHNLEYQISADFDFFVRALYSGMKFKHIDIIIAKYDMEGFSSQVTNATKAHKEYIKIVRKNLSNDIITFLRCTLRYYLMRLKFKIKLFNNACNLKRLR
ncbi:MAG: glycosyltransferase [Weizmannia coagulans]|jgi:glycosyltransferase involved in cell wall biosynthesis|uniref:glycosyltransferase family 2 protein n=1 Tax=Heyndrickxia coagulans TaxID=1398 RepID=UPI0014595065|nr:glycosyltransferase family 2 protein [Heyndrickxia coagulans]MCI1575004.1 glycosyltransferase [Heyndrickxia coagulans]NMH83998.1 glycosyltransferase [Heyndrickxia coagulans]